MPKITMEDMDEYNELLLAMEGINYAMIGKPKEYATSLMVALRDYICDAYADDDMGYLIAKEVANGKL
jgi:hypothetical protein